MIEIRNAAVIGAGTMGLGIAGQRMVRRLANVPVAVSRDDVLWSLIRKMIAERELTEAEA